MAPLHFDLEFGTRRQTQMHSIEPRVTRFHKHGRRRSEELLYLSRNLLSGQFLVHIRGLSQRRVESKAVVFDHCSVVRAHHSSKRGDEVAEVDASEMRSRIRDGVNVSNYLWHTEQGRPANCAVIREDCANTKEKVRPVDNGVRGQRTDLAPEYPSELWVMLGKEAFRCRLQDDGAAKGLGKPHQLTLHPGLPDLGTNENDRLVL